MKISKLLLLLIPTFFLLACGETEQTTTEKKAVLEPNNALNLEWQRDGLKAPESVIYDPENYVLYVSNINGGPTDKDANGFISRLSLSGEIMDLNWVTGLNAPKGLAIYEGKLYVADIDALVEIDIQTANINHRYPADDAKFLNDVTVNGSGEVFVSDMLTNTIHNLKEGQLSTWLQSEELLSPNGLHAEKDRLVVGVWGKMTDGFATDIPGHLKAISYKDKSISDIGSGETIGNMDGVEAEGTTYLVTDWIAGKLFRVNSNGDAKLLLHLEQGMADHEWIGELRVVLLPMMKNDKLLAYRLSK